MITRRKIKPSDLERIAEATREAEKKTSGEIVTVIANSSDSYSKPVLWTSLTVVVFFSFIYILSLGGIERFLQREYWDYGTRHTLLYLLVGQLLFFTLAYGLLNLIGTLAVLKFFRHGDLAYDGEEPKP